MKLKGLGIILVSLLILQAVSTYNFSVKAAIQGTEKPDVYFGVDVAYENLTETKLTVDKTSSYTNLFVIGCYGNYNETRLSEICQYVYEKNMSFIVYTDDPNTLHRYGMTKPEVRGVTVSWGYMFGMKLAENSSTVAT